MSDPAPGPSVASGDVLVIGDLIVDVITHHRQPIGQGTDTAAQIHLSGGGSAANTAAWLATMDETPRLVAAVGDDEVGRGAIEGLADAGVTYAGPILEGGTTGCCVVLVGPDKGRTMLPDRGANDQLPVTAVTESIDRSPGWVHLSGYTLLGAGSRPAGQAAVSAALAAGHPVSVDAASAAPMRAVGAAHFLRWIEGAAIVFANDDEIDVLGGVDAVLARVDAVVVKHGAAGATWTDGVRSSTMDGLPVEVVDTTGAGDAFAAGWIAAVRRGQAEEAALAAAVAAGAAAVAQDGARPAPAG